MSTIPKIASVDFRTYYDLERTLFEIISPRFEAERSLTAFDFFCIVIWKANRAKSKIARRLLAHGNYTDLDSAVRTLSSEIANTPSSKDKLHVLIGRWGFLLPMASAILTVLYPADFTVYDARVCDMLGDFKWVVNRTRYDDLWDGYARYSAAVKQAAPAELSLRDKDRWLWGKSFFEELQEDIATKFSRTRKLPAEEQA